MTEANQVNYAKDFDHSDDHSSPLSINCHGFPENTVSQMLSGGSRPVVYQTYAKSGSSMLQQQVTPGYVQGVRKMRKMVSPMQTVAVRQLTQAIRPGSRPVVYQTYAKSGSSMLQQQVTPGYVQGVRVMHKMVSPMQTVAVRQVTQVIRHDQNGAVVNGMVVKNEVTQATQQVSSVVPKQEAIENYGALPNGGQYSAVEAIPQGLGPPPQESEIAVKIQNVVCNYSLPMHIDLRKFALNSWNCCYDRSKSVLTKQKRHPECHVKLFSSGKVYIVGCKSEVDSRRAARSLGREIQRIMGKTGERVTLRKFRINNIMATCKLPFGIAIHELARKYPKETYFEPELTVGLIWKMVEPKASLRIHTTGTIVITGATSENDVMLALEKIYGPVMEFRCDPSRLPRTTATRKRANIAAGSGIIKKLRVRSLDEEDNAFGGDSRLLFEDEADLYDDEDFLIS